MTDRSAYQRDCRRLAARGLTPSDVGRPHTVALDFPKDHPRWGEFVRWVETAGVVRADLLADEDRRDHWQVVWRTWLAGYEAGHATKPAPVRRTRVAWEDTPAGRLYRERVGTLAEGRDA
jgi:hypothetical protein